MKQQIGINTHRQDREPPPGRATDGPPPPWPATPHPLLSPTLAVIHTHQGAVTRLSWSATPTPQNAADAGLLAQVRDWLADYFSGHCRPPTFPLLWQGTPFQQRLGEQLATIAVGQTLTYGALAQRLGSGPRAVGQGVGSNPLPLLLPCHRVVARDGVGGYSGPGGVTTKQWLLAWERQLAPPGPVIY
ncbi:MAG: methylated-DNA--[protein]-cysteine S-methyltransferase [Magnetococcus sp. MYC-9]